jgi:hypothetical protein
MVMTRYLLVDEFDTFGGKAFNGTPGGVSSVDTSEAFHEDPTHHFSEEWTWVQQ